MIPKNDALKLMEQTDERGNRIPFSFKYVTADREAFRRREKYLASGWTDKAAGIDIGGDILELENVTMIRNKKISDRKDPRHYQNRTRNVKLPNGELRKFHISLLTALKHPYLNADDYVTVIH